MSAAPDERRGLDAGRKGLELLDQALAKRPEKDGHLLSGACRCLCLYREDLIAAARGGSPEDRRRLEHLNAVLGVVAGAHYPLGQIPWDELEKSKGWLEALVGPCGPP